MTKQQFLLHLQQKAVNLRDVHITSRSAYQAYHGCNYLRYLEYIAHNGGIRLKGSKIYFLTGSAVHAGVQAVAKEVKRGKEGTEDLQELAASEAIDYFKTKTKEDPSDLWGRHLKTKEQKEYAYQEQITIAEALARVWVMRELPVIRKYYEIVQVERDVIVALDEQANIYMESKVDMVLSRREGGDLVNYSLKTPKKYEWRDEKSYGIDLQSLTEWYATEEDGKYQYQLTKDVCSKLKSLKPPGWKDQYTFWLSNAENDLYMTSKVLGTKFCYLIKGQSREVKKDKDNSIWEVDSPLVRGYKKFSANEKIYAHSFWFANPKTPSGKGRLGKGWERFRVWEEFPKGGVKRWLKMLDDSAIDGMTGRKVYKIQPECGDILKSVVVTPEERFRHRSEMKRAIEQITETERTIKRHITDLELYRPDLIFVPDAQHCFYPDDCQMLPICHLKEPFTGRDVPPDVRDCPLEGEDAWYERRDSHHGVEQERLVQIRGES